MYGYRKEKGWNGKRYLVKMSAKETEERRVLEMVLGVPVVMIVMSVLFCLAAGIIR